MDNKTVQQIIHVANTHNLFDFKLILKLRHVSKFFKETVDNVFLYFILDTMKRIEPLLKYDTTIYDTFSYKRKILANKTEQYFEKYKKLSVPHIKNNKITARKLPAVYYVFLKYFIDHPSIKIDLFPPAMLEKIIQWQKTFLKDNVNEDGILCIIPLCFTMHFKESRADKQFISVFCYVNIITSNICAIFENKKYFSFEIDELQDTEAKIFDCIMQKIKNFTEPSLSADTQTEYLAVNIAKKSSHFGDAFADFYKKGNIFMR